MNKKGWEKFGITLAILFFLIVATSTTLTRADAPEHTIKECYNETMLHWAWTCTEWTYDPIVKDNYFCTDGYYYNDYNYTEEVCVDIELPKPSVRIADSASSKEWEFNIIEEDNDIYTNISIVNETVLELILDAFDIDSLPANYKWDMAVCNISGINWLQYMEEDAQGGFDDSYPEDLEYVFLEYEGLPSDWCESTGGYGFVLFSSGSKNQLPEHFRLIFPNTTEKFELYFGNGTGILVGLSHTSSTEHSYTDKMVRDSNNNLHILFRDDGKDPHHWNSTDNTTFNSVADITTTDGDRMNLVIDSNNNLYAIYSDSSGLASSSWPKFRHDERNTGCICYHRVPLSLGTMVLILLLMPVVMTLGFRLSG